MDDSNEDQGDVAYAGKLKNLIFKQLLLEQLLKNGIINTTSKLAKPMSLELQRNRDFEASIQDEERNRGKAIPAP